MIVLLLLLFTLLPDDEDEVVENLSIELSLKIDVEDFIDDEEIIKSICKIGKQTDVKISTVIFGRCIVTMDINMFGYFVVRKASTLGIQYSSTNKQTKSILLSISKI